MARITKIELEQINAALATENTVLRSAVSELNAALARKEQQLTKSVAAHAADVEHYELVIRGTARVCYLTPSAAYAAMNVLNEKHGKGYARYQKR